MKTPVNMISQEVKAAWNFKLKGACMRLPYMSRSSLLFFMVVKGHLRSPEVISENHVNMVSQAVKVAGTSNLVY